MLMKFLSRSDSTRFEYHIVSLLGDGSLTDWCRKEGHRAFNISRSSSLLNLPVQFIKVLHFCLQEKIDLIQTFGLRADTIGRIAGRISGVPVIISSIRSPDPWRKPWHTFLDDITSGNVDLFISNSEAGRQSRIEREKFPPEKIVTIHNGVEIPELPTDEERARHRERFVDEADRFIVAVLANFRSMKGHTDILEAARELSSLIPHILFIFAGEGPLRQDIEEEVVLDPVLRRIIIFPGVVEEPFNLLHASDVFLLASHWEGCPASILEAMAAGVPVVATRVGGIPELVEHEVTGLLIPPKKPFALKDALVRLYENPSLAAQISHHARRTVEKHFSLDIMTKKIESLFSQLIERKRKDSTSRFQ